MWRAAGWTVTVNGTLTGLPAYAWDSVARCALIWTIRVPAGTAAQDALKAAGVAYDLVPPRYRTTYFNHVFSGGYSAGYYSYLWSEVMDADTWDYFVQSGDVFNPDIGRRYKDIILAPGNTTDRGEASPCSASMVARIML